MPLLDPRLPSFLVLAELGSFHRAAARLGISQPALTQRIARLEEDVGAALFHREARGVRLTGPGRILVEVGRDLTLRAEGALSAVREAEAASENRLVLGYVEYGVFPFLPPALRRLRELLPAVEVVRRELHTELQVEALLRGEIDVGIGPPPTRPGREGELLGKTLLEGEWMLVLPTRHPLARRPRVPLEALDGAPIVTFQRTLNPPLFGRLLAACDAAGFEPNIVFETAQAMVGPKLVAEGIGLFLVASYVIPKLPRGLVARPVDGLGGPFRVSALYRKGPKRAAVRAFLRALDDR